MTDPTQQPQTEPIEIHQTAAGEVLRMLWLAWGNAALLFAAGFIAKQPAWTFTWTDALYWGLVAALITIRYVDIAWFRGLTANGEPATMRHWFRYAPTLTGIAAGFWTAGQAVQL
jgi:hypothetical protein